MFWTMKKARPDPLGDFQNKNKIYKKYSEYGKTKIKKFLFELP